MVETGSHTKQSVLEILSRIKDPEIPVLSIQEMGMLHDVKLSDDLCEVFIMPTYSGCPAMGIIEEDIYTLA
jgi:ring-1,2-phenylacetyl-CoA epoxidase subunit PaaD